VSPPLGKWTPSHRWLSAAAATTAQLLGDRSVQPPGDTALLASVRIDESAAGEGAWEKDLEGPGTAGGSGVGEKEKIRRGTGAPPLDLWGAHG
jgi:hypothetical protein